MNVAKIIFTIFRKDMMINNVNTCNTNFKSAKDLNLRYMLNKNSQYLPESVLKEVQRLCSSGKNELPSLPEVHQRVYQRLFNATSLEEIKSNYPELSEVIDIITLKGNRSKAIKAIESLMPLENFTLNYIKELYQPLRMEQLVEKYKLTNRSILSWLNEKLHINKLSSNYFQLLRMSNEEENLRIAECSRRAILNNPEAQQKRLEKAAETHRTSEYRAKKSKEIKDFYQRNPEAAQKTGLISKRTWDRCPQIKEALKEYTKNADTYTKSILVKRSMKIKLSNEEKRILNIYYKNFWDTYPEYKAVYREARLQVIKELSSEA